MMIAVYGGVAVVGQAMKSPSDKTAMMIHVFIVILVRRLYFTMWAKGRNSANLARLLAYPLTWWLVCRILPFVGSQPRESMWQTHNCLTRCPSGFRSLLCSWWWTRLGLVR